jgi:hypothetical protein
MNATEKDLLVRLQAVKKSRDLHRRIADRLFAELSEAKAQIGILKAAAPDAARLLEARDRIAVLGTGLEAAARILEGSANKQLGGAAAARALLSTNRQG